MIRHFNELGSWFLSAWHKCYVIVECNKIFIFAHPSTVFLAVTCYIPGTVNP